MTGQVPQTSRSVAQPPSSRCIARMKKMRMRSPSCLSGAATLTLPYLLQGIVQFKAPCSTIEQNRM